MNGNCKTIRNGIEILLELLEWETVSRAGWKTNKDIHTHGVGLYSLRLRCGTLGRENSGIDISALGEFHSSKLNVHKGQFSKRNKNR